MGIGVKIIGANTYLKSIDIWDRSIQKDIFRTRKGSDTYMNRQETAVKRELIWYVHFVMKKIVLKFG